MSETFQQIGTRIGALVEVKNAAYGSSFETSAGALALLYPKGIMPEQMADALLLVRMWDKMQRIATDRDALGESPYGDIAGYGILGVAAHSKREVGQEKPCGSVQDAKRQSPEIEPSAAASTAASDATRLDTTQKSAPSVMPSNALWHVELKQYSPRGSATAPPATESVASSSESVAAVLREASDRNLRELCAGCGGRLQGYVGLKGYVGLLAERATVKLIACCPACTKLVDLRLDAARLMR